VGCADHLQAVRHDLEREVGAVAFAAEVAKKEAFQVSRHDFLRYIGGGLVREVAVAAENPLFEAPWPGGTILEHLDIVVGFEDEAMSRPHALEHELRGMAEIGEEPEIAGGGPHEESHRVLRIVRDAEGFDGDIPDLERGARAEDPEVQGRFELVLNGFLGEAIAVNRNVQLLAKGFQAGRVVGMLVRDENTTQALGRAPYARKALAYLAQTEPCIDEEAGLICLKIGAIPGGTAAKNG